MLSTSGDTHLGGDDIDEVLIRLVLKEIEVAEGRRFQPIRKAVNKAKEDLSSRERDGNRHRIRRLTAPASRARNSIR